MEADGAPSTPPPLPLSELRFTGIQSYGYTDQRKVEADVEVTEDRTGDLLLRKPRTSQLSHDCSSETSHGWWKQPNNELFTRKYLLWKPIHCLAGKMSSSRCHCQTCAQNVEGTLGESVQTKGIIAHFRWFYNMGHLLLNFAPGLGCWKRGQQWHYPLHKSLCSTVKQRSQKFFNGEWFSRKGEKKHPSS